MIAFVAVLFYALTVIGIFILRLKRPEIERPYKAFGYPVLPAIYILLATVFCVALIIQKPAYVGWGLAIVLLGIPLYYLAGAGGSAQGVSMARTEGWRGDGGFWAGGISFFESVKKIRLTFLRWIENQIVIKSSLF